MRFEDNAVWHCSVVYSMMRKRRRGCRRAEKYDGVVWRGVEEMVG